MEIFDLTQNDSVEEADDSGDENVVTILWPSGRWEKSAEQRTAQTDCKRRSAEQAQCNRGQPSRCIKLNSAVDIVVCSADHNGACAGQPKERE